MKDRRNRVLTPVVVIVVAVVVIVLWPAPDPLEGVEAVAIRVGDGGSTSQGVDLEEELRVVLGDRDIRIVSDEESADVVLELTDLTVNLGDVEFSLSEAGLRGRASAVCTLRDVRTGRVHVMDFHVRFEEGAVTADLVPRKFWEFWKRRPGA